MDADSDKRYRSTFFSALLAASVISLFLYYRRDVLAAFKDINTSWILLGLLSFLFNYLFRALRIQELTKYKVKVFPGGIYCSSLHGFATYMLPVRAGELSLPFILKSISGIEVSMGIKVLYKARLLDIFILGSWLMVAAVFPVSKLPVAYKSAMGGLGLLMVLTPIILAKFSSRLLARLERFKAFATSLPEYSRFSANEILLSIGVWVASAGMLWCITAAMHINMTIDELFFLVAIQLVMQLFPIQGVANTGNHESGWMAAMIVIGYPVEAALKFTLASHTIILVFVLFLGIVALTFRQIHIRRDPVD